MNPNTKIISKIETLEAVNNLNDILNEVDFILIDRGDLSTEIGIEKIPRFQNYIIQMANHKGIKVFLATQILKIWKKSLFLQLQKLMICTIYQKVVFLVYNFLNRQPLGVT
ncbi:hypothetical protein H2268_05525 [Campylobacter sp. RM12910]|uniref:pyruvate kinase n=1 Tax=Campylobacter molothri TaxID=1032242 RepID=UPI0030AF48BD|nr:hypothetical protein [Campylobacter sp. RM12910]